jgi:hypothetical protein
LETKHDLLIARPGVIARKTGALFRNEIQQLNNILGQTKPREAAIQQYLEENPAIFKSLGYVKAYPQIVLERDDGTSLQPDFILEPIGGEWFDILEVKLPHIATVVGRRDRKTLAAVIHSMAAQLREYAAYFDDPRLAKRIEDIYGIKCYKPRLIGIIGHGSEENDDRQLRRVMTSYADLQIITFDQLHEIAQARLLV